MDEILGFVKAHRRLILRIGRKLVRAFKRRKQQAGMSAGMGAGMGAGMASGGPSAHYGPGPGYGPGAGWSAGPEYVPPSGAPGGPAPNTQAILGTSDIHAFDDNNVNAQNPQYKDLRNRARSEGDKMAHCFRASKTAYQRGDGAQAKQLSDEGHFHQHQMEQLNAQAVQWIYAANNADSPPGTIDVHGLYVKEALAKVDEVIRQAQAQNFPQLRIIVGKGIHSKDHVSHIRPAVEDMLHKYQIAAHVDPKNRGVLVVDMQAPRGGSDSAALTRDVAQHITGNDQEVRAIRLTQCIVM